MTPSKMPRKDRKVTKRFPLTSASLPYGIATNASGRPGRESDALEMSSVEINGHTSDTSQHRQPALEHRQVALDLIALAELLRDIAVPSH